MKLNLSKLLLLVNILFIIFPCFSTGEQIRGDYPYNVWDEKELREIVKDYENKYSVERSTKALKILGIAYHNLAVLGNRGVAKRSVRYLKKLRNTLPGDIETLAYLGSATTILGRDSFNPINKIRYVSKGTKLIDKAIKNEPNNIVMRILRISNSRALPGFFGRYKFVEKDLEFLLEFAEKEPLLFPSGLLANIYYLKGEVLKDKGKISSAQEFWRKAVEVSPESPSGKKASERLKKVYTQ